MASCEFSPWEPPRLQGGASTSVSLPRSGGCMSLGANDRDFFLLSCLVSRRGEKGWKRIFSLPKWRTTKKVVKLSIKSLQLVVVVT